MRAVHFGAGNIGRGFIGEILAKNGFEIDFVDVNDNIINALKKNREYDIEIASFNQKKIHVKNVNGINNNKEPEKVIEAIKNANIVTTAIGPNILKFVAPLIAKGIQARKEIDNKQTLDIIACENMIGGSQYLRKEVYNYLDEDTKIFSDEYIGFPNAAVDRIVPLQNNDDPLLVSVEEFKEWVIDESQMKNPSLKLIDVHYTSNLEPYIERKLFSVNTGHATVAYIGGALGYKTIGEAIKDERVLKHLRKTLQEIRSLLLAKWKFKESELINYHEKIIQRFKNPYISDDINRVGRTPIRKLGYDERFIRPIRELKSHNLSYSALIETVGKIYKFNDSKDEESQMLQAMLKDKDLEEVIIETTNLNNDKELVIEIEKSVKATK